MVVRPVVIAVICVGLFLILESLMLPKAMALKTNGFRMQDQRIHKRRNYMSQRARDQEILKSLQKSGVSYDMDIVTLDAASTMPKRLAYIVNANTIIDDEYFLDKSVETRTRKRNIKRGKQRENQAIPDPACRCDYINSTVTVDKNAFPRKLFTRECRKEYPPSCISSYKCQEIYYDVPILMKKSRNDSLPSYVDLSELLPNHLNISWYATTIQIPVGCQCVKQFEEEINLQK